eukprot:11011537-Heterocapsa_arctica.AAC.1
MMVLTQPSRLPVPLDSAWVPSAHSYVPCRDAETHGYELEKQELENLRGERWLRRREVERHGPAVQVPDKMEEIDRLRRRSGCDNVVKFVLA